MDQNDLPPQDVSEPKYSVSSNPTCWTSAVISWLKNVSSLHDVEILIALLLLLLFWYCTCETNKILRYSSKVIILSVYWCVFKISFTRRESKLKVCQFLQSCKTVVSSLAFYLHMCQCLPGVNDVVFLQWALVSHIIRRMLFFKIYDILTMFFLMLEHTQCFCFFCFCILASL